MATKRPELARRPDFVRRQAPDRQASAHGRWRARCGSRAKHKMPDPAPPRRGAGGFSEVDHWRQQAAASHGCRRVAATPARHGRRLRGCLEEIISGLDDFADPGMALGGPATTGPALAAAGIGATCLTLATRGIVAAASQARQLAMHGQWQPADCQPQCQQSRGTCQRAEAKTRMRAVQPLFREIF